MKRLLFVVLAATMFVACTKDTGAAEKQMTEYKAQWSEITSLLDAEAVDAEGFDAWYNTLTNSEVRDLYAAVDELSLSYEEAEHWYKNLSDAEQQAVRTVAEAWEVENPALQLQVELFAEILMGVEFPKLEELKDEERKWVCAETKPVDWYSKMQDMCTKPLLKVYYPKVTEEAAETDCDTPSCEDFPNCVGCPNALDEEVVE